MGQSQLDWQVSFDLNEFQKIRFYKFEALEHGLRVESSIHFFPA